jgi:benzoate membrane transport protein
MFKNISLSNMTAGFVAVMVGYTSSVVIIFQAAAAAGASSAQVSSWLLALGVGMAVSSIGLSLYYRIPILTAWSTSGAALLVTSLSGVSMPETIGAFIFSAILIMLSGMTGLFEKAMAYIPRSLVSAMLAGILLQFGTNVFSAMQNQFILVFTLFCIYLIGKHFFPRFVILFILLLGTLIAGMKGLLHLEQFHFALSSPVFTAPVFSLPALVSVGIPLFIVTMTSQNIPGIAIMNSAGYQPRVSPIISWTGVTNLLLAPFGGFSINMAAVSAGICLSKEADIDPAKRYKATVYAGLFHLIAGLFSATVVTLFSALPKELILSIAGLALLGTIGNNLKNAVEDETQREPALITLLVTASGISLLGIGATFWGLVAGILSYALLNAYKSRQYTFIKNFGISVKTLCSSYLTRSDDLKDQTVNED